MRRARGERTGSGGEDFREARHVRRLEQDFLKDGGLRERMTKARLESRARGR